MTEYVTFSRFCDVFMDSDTYKNNFTYEGLKALYDYLESIEDDTSEPIEFDMVALCCGYTEFDDLEDIQAQYENIVDRDDLECQTTVIDCENGHIIIQNF